MLYKLLQNKYIPRVLYERCIKWLCSVVCTQGGVNRESRVRGLVRDRSVRWVSICGSVDSVTECNTSGYVMRGRRVLRDGRCMQSEGEGVGRRVERWGR